MNRYFNTLLLSVVFCVSSLFSVTNNSASWLAYANKDLRAAITLKNDQNVDCALYHIEQAVEKALKAYLINTGTSFALTHDLVPLLNSCCKHDACFQDFCADIKEINPYSTKSRYPNKSYVEPSIQEVDGLINKANTLVIFISNKIN